MSLKIFEISHTDDEYIFSTTIRAESIEQISEREVSIDNDSAFVEVEGTIIDIREVN